MKRILCLIGLTVTLMLVVMSTSSCSGDKLVLNVYNWGEYISDGSDGLMDINAEFEEYCRTELGMEVEVLYSTYATNEDMYNKIYKNAGSYDIVIPSDYMIERMIADDLLYEFDATQLENFGNLSEDFIGDNCYYDKGNRYSVPYTYGMVGVIYNTDHVAPEDVKDESWALMWNEDYSGKILQFNNPRDGFGTAMYYLGIDVNTTNQAEWDAALEALKTQKPLLQAYVNDEIFDKMTTGSAYVSSYFAGDYITMYYDLTDYGEYHEDNFLGFYYPDEGTNYFVDAMCIPKNSQNKELAMEYINFMLREDVAVDNALYIGYATPNEKVKNSETYIEGMGEYAMDILYKYTPSEANATPYYNLADKTVITEDGEEINAQTYLNSAWEELRTWSAVEPWIHVVSIGIVVGILSACVYSIYIKKKRSRFYRYRDRDREQKQNK